MVYFTMRAPNSQLVSGKVTFDTTIANVGGGYNNQTGEFVCPVAGLYHFYFSFMQKSATNVFCFIKHNKASLTQAETFSDGTGETASASAYVQLQVGDTVSISNCYNYEFVNHGGAEGIFTGSLIHL